MATSMQQSAARPGRGRQRVEAGLVSLALAGNNAASYALNVVAAHILLPEAFGELSSLLALLVIGVVPAMGLQTVVALRVASSGHRKPATGTTGPLVTLGLTTAGAVTLLGLLVSPALVWLLHLDGVLPALWLVLALAPLTLLGLFHGLLQGTRRFGVLAGLVLFEGAAKTGGSLLGLLLAESSSAAMAGAAAGSVLVVLVGWLVCGMPRPASGMRRAGEVVHAAQALLALILLVNLDLLLARHTLPAAEAGQYALGAIVAKVAYWLPQAVGVLVLPRLARARERHRALPAALLVCAAIGTCVVGGAAVAGGWALDIIAGSDSPGSAMAVWPFALVGTLLSLVQLLLFARIADGDRRVTLLMWSAVVVEVLLVSLWLHGSITQVVLAAVVTVSALAAAGFAMEWRTRRR